ncbi:MAG: TadG family pilus assembly protein [Moraxellaceae bacterium]|nr:TadG family pilus assembly protein [Moraxellaceae bacterium]MDZ4387592.1 TadG family pilus assembly protein [Moraxellaceae bacterium]
MKKRIGRQSQHGAVFALVAGFMMLGISFLALSVDSGRLYLDKRSLQKVADIAALEAAGQLGSCADALMAAQASAARNGFVHDSDNHTITVRCGNVVSSQGVRDLQDDSEFATAVLVTVRRTSPASIIAGGMFGDDIQLQAEAMASRKGSSLAALTIRSTLLGVSLTNANQATRLNRMLGTMLGSPNGLSLTVGAWNGLLHTDINLFEYIDQLAINLGFSVGEVDQVLSANVSAGTLIQAAIDVIDSKIGTPQATINALDAIVAMDHINVVASISPTTLKVGQILGVDPDGKYDDAVLNLQLFQLIQGIVQLANSENFAVAVVPLSIGGATVEVRTKVIEPPRFSAIGDPFKSLSGESDPIYVRTAQVKVLLSVTLSSFSSSLVSAIQNEINNIIVPITNIINNLLALDLIGALGFLISSGPRDFTDIQIAPAPFRFDINIDVAAGEAEVSGASCGGGGNKSLTVPTSGSAVTVRIGKMGNTISDAVNSVFDQPNFPPALDPAPLIDVGMKRCQVTCLVACVTTSCEARVPFYSGGVALKEERHLLGGQENFLFEAPALSELPEINQMPKFKSVSASPNIVSMLSESLYSPTIQMYVPSGGGPLSTLVSVGTLLDSLIGLLQGAVRTVLSPLLDPLLNLLILTAGIDLAKTEVGANLTCSSETGVQLLR